MSFLTQRSQIGVEIEDVEGVAETISSSSLVEALNISPVINLNPIRRPIQRGTFSKLPSIAGIQDGQVSFDMQFAGPGNGSVGTPAPVGKFLRAGGFRQVVAYAVELSTFSGAFLANGDVLDADDTGAKVRVLGTKTKASFDLGETHGDILFYELLTPGTNIGATDTALTCNNPSLSLGVSHLGTTPVLGLSSQTGTAAGYAWVPTSLQTQTITVSSASGTFQVGEIISQVVSTSPNVYAYGRVVAVNISSGSGTIEFVPADASSNFQTTATPPGQVTGVTSGATADVDANAVASQTPSATVKTFEDGISKLFVGSRALLQMNFETGGFPTLNVTLRGAYSAVADESNLSAGANLQGTVYAFRGVEHRLRDSDSNYLTCTANIGFDMGSNLVQQTCATAASGLDSFIITDRTPTMTMDPRAVQEIVFDSYQKAKEAGTFDMLLRFGNYSGSVAGVNSWLIQGDTCQFESLNTGDRDGVITSQGTVQLNDVASREDGEMVIINYSAAVVEAL